MSSFAESPVIGQRWVMGLSQSNPLHHLLHRCQLIRWHAGMTLFDLLCWTWKHFHKQTTESRRFKSPKISFTEAGVVLQHLPWAKRYFLTEERHHLADRKHTPSAHSGLFVNQVYGKDSEGAHKEKPASGVFKNAGILDLQLFWNNAHTIANYRKALWSWMHHEEGIPHLTLGQLKPQLGLIKQQRRGASLPRWERADGIGFTAPQQWKHQRAIPPATLPIAAWAWYQIWKAASHGCVSSHLSSSSLSSHVVTFPTPSSCSPLFRALRLYTF